MEPEAGKGYEMNTLVFIMVALIIAMVALAFWLWWLYRREYNRRWDEISNAFSEEKHLREVINDQVKDVLHYQDLYHQEMVQRFCLAAENAKLTDKLSALYCPTNNHVWKDGKCIKCGRRQHELD